MESKFSGSMGNFPISSDDNSIPIIPIETVTESSEEHKPTLPSPPFNEETKENSKSRLTVPLTPQIFNQYQNHQHLHNIQVKEKTNRKHKITKDDYNLIKLLGDGAFSKVVLVDEIKSGKRFAMKIMEKAFLSKVNINEIDRRKKKHW